MAVYELPAKEEYGPFQATIGTDGAYDSGHIRIEPPFQPGTSLIDSGFTDGITFEHFATTDEATLLDYAIPNSNGNSDENLSVVCENLDFILSHLGHAVLRENFINHWQQFKQR